MKYTVLSPWAEVDVPFAKGLNKRLDTLEGKTIGMFSHFKGHSPYILREVEKEIRKKYQNISFSYHAPKYVPLPLKDPSISCRKFWSADHLQVFVTGSSDTPRCAVMPGSGDHGGPACVRLQLPKAWDQLVKEYAPVKQEFVNY